jgi:hypothetical protein
MMQSVKILWVKELYEGIIYLEVILTEKGISLGGRHLRSLHTIKEIVPFKTVEAEDLIFTFCTKSTLLL